MSQYALRRILLTLPTALLVAIITFFLIHLTPGDAAAFYVDMDFGTQEEIERVRERLGLNEPLHIQFISWFGSVLRGDLGMSFHQRRPVMEMFLHALPPSILLTSTALFLAIIIAIPLGIVAALNQNTWIDKVTSAFVLLGLAMPNFWLGLLLILTFSLQLGWLPVQGYVRPQDDFVGSMRHLVLPSITLGYTGAALIARMTRSAMLEIIRQDYIRTARSKGLRERRINFRHALSNAFNPILTVIGLTVVGLLSGNIVVELVFNYPGVGRLVVDSIFRRDYPVIQGSLLLIATVTILVNLLVDLLYVAVDPRIRYE